MATPLDTPAYCTPEQMLLACDYRNVADWANDDDGPRPSRAALLDPDSVPGQVLLAAIQEASGDIAAAAFARAHYTPDDLAALTGSAAVMLHGMAARLALWALANRRNPGTADPQKVPGLAQAQQRLEELRNGTKIFPLQGQADAGAGMAAITFVDTAAAGRTVNQASRFFGPRGCR